MPEERGLRIALKVVIVGLYMHIVLLPVLLLTALAH
jgi:hypothetical protein